MGGDSPGLKMVKSHKGIKEEVRIVFPREDRPAISTTAFAVLLIIVIVVGGAIGISYPRSTQKASSTSTATTSSTASSATTSSASTSSSATSTSSTTTSSSASANTNSTPPSPAPPLFNFTLSSGPDTILMSAGSTIVYPNLYITPLPSAFEGQAAGLNYGAGDELVVVNSAEPSGLSLQFFGSTLANTIYEEVAVGFTDTIEIQMNASSSMAPGNYPVMVEASSGTLSVNYSFTVQIVKYLITAQYGEFSPGHLTVPVGSTVYWMNISTDPNGFTNVVFNTTSVESPNLDPCVLSSYQTGCGVFAYTFTTAGTYSYVCNALPACGQGTITVTD